MLDISYSVLTQAYDQLKQHEICTDTIADQKLVLKVLESEGLGSSQIPRRIAELPTPPRCLLVALLLDRYGKATNCIKFPEILTAYQSYTEEINWPPLPSYDDARKALEVLVSYALVRGGPTGGLSTKPLDEVLTCTIIFRLLLI